jgi:arginyl-tRNA synthetase
MVLAKELRANPREIAQQIIARLELSDIGEPPEIAGAGFINFRLKEAFLRERFLSLLHDDAARRLPAGTEKKDGHRFQFAECGEADALSATSARRYLETRWRESPPLSGTKLSRDNHIGDWGTQFGMLIVGWKSELDKSALAGDPLAEMERIYKKISARCKEEPSILEKRASGAGQTAAG